MKEQEWKTIPRYENYEISTLGIIRNKKGKIKSYQLNNGYKRVNLCKDGYAKTFLVHQLMAITFLNHIPNGHEIVVDHINGNKLNNQLSNLQLLTNRENIIKSINKSTGKYSSKYFNITFCKKLKKFKVIVRKNSKQLCIGSYKSEEKAKQVLDSYNNFIQKKYESITV